MNDPGCLEFLFGMAMGLAYLVLAGWGYRWANRNVKPSGPTPPHDYGL